MASKKSGGTIVFPPNKPSCQTNRWWWSKETVAIVTGGNKGIGFAIVKRLAELGVSVILTARDIAKGEAALEQLQLFGLNNYVHFLPLDVSQPSSIATFASSFSHKFQSLDILINNAAISFNEIDSNTVEHAETVMRTNFYGPKLLTEALLPFFRRSSLSNSRILNITSRLGLPNKVKDPNVRKILSDEKHLSEKKIEKIVEMFLEDVKNETWQNKGWPQVWTDYAVSKLALNAYSTVLARRYDGKGISVNCYCPGFTQTSMTGGKGKHTAEAAADIAVKLALLPPEGLTTGMFYAGNNPGVYCKM